MSKLKTRAYLVSILHSSKKKKMFNEAKIDNPNSLMGKEKLRFKHIGNKMHSPRNFR